MAAPALIGFIEAIIEHDPPCEACRNSALDAKTEALALVERLERAEAALREAKSIALNTAIGSSQACNRVAKVCDEVLAGGVST